jgi:hypothetical protein
VNPKLIIALEERNPANFLWMAQRSYPYEAPEDFELLDEQGQLVVAVAMFSTVFGSSGYAGVLDELRNRLDSITQSLESIRAEPYATEMRRITRLLQQEELMLDSDEDLWSSFVEANGDFRRETQRDLLSADERIASALRNYILAKNGNQ